MEWLIGAGVASGWIACVIAMLRVSGLKSDAAELRVNAERDAQALAAAGEAIRAQKKDIAALEDSLKNAKRAHKLLWDRLGDHTDAGLAWDAVVREVPDEDDSGPG